METEYKGPMTRSAWPWLAVLIMTAVTGVAVFAWCRDRQLLVQTRQSLASEPKPAPTLVEPRFPSAAIGKKALYINAYHPGYAWSDVEQKAAEAVFKQAGVEYRIFYMDTKQKNAPEQIKASAEEAHKFIEEFKPDIVIVQDDNPVKHVFLPWYRNSEIPFVFCGVNWDCGRYDLPCKNITGMLEVSLIPQILDTVRPLAKGPRIALLGNDNETDHLEGAMIPKRFGIQWSQERYVKTFDEWKTAYKELQDQADIIFWYGSAGIKEWNDGQARAFIQENTRIVTCSSQYYMAEFVLVGHMKLGEEQGDWAANAAVQILAGKSPMHIPVAQNKNARITLNMRLAKQLNVVFPVTLVEQAELIR
jgi:ABC-type uncharacterized transport system substrate-binding protein